jgi:hypothetical protein
VVNERKYRCVIISLEGVRKMKSEEVRLAVKNRYGKFAEKGGSKESC